MGKLKGELSQQSTLKVTYHPANTTQEQFPLTVFAFGTGEMRSMKSKNIISQFSEACTGSKIIADGPRMLGKEVVPNTDQIVEQILECLRSHTSKEGAIRVNLTGFSRGAITCICVANALQAFKNKLRQNQEDPDLLAKLERLDLNLFLIDPVSGLGEKKIRERRVIPENVKNCITVLQTDEMRREFKPQDRSRLIVEDPEKTQMMFFPLYGNHSDSTKIKEKGMSAAPELVWQTLFQFMTMHGTTFENGMPDMAFKMVPTDLPEIKREHQTSPKELLKMYETLHLERDDYLASGKKFKFADSLMLRRTRSINAQLELYVKDSDIFVNTLERELMKVAYPKVFNYLFENHAYDPRFPNDSHADFAAVQKEFETLKTTHPWLFARLKQKQKLQKDGKLPNTPGGYALLTSLSTLEMLYPKITAKLIPCDAAMTKLERLEQKIIDLTLRYEREKSHLRPFYHKNEWQRTQAIRTQMLDIMKNEPVDAEQKTEKIIEMLSEHARYLRYAHSRSKLADDLEKLIGIEKLSLEPSVVSEIIYCTLTMLKEVVNFVGSLAYIGGGVLSALGIVVRDIGFRLEDSMRHYESYPLKVAVLAVAHLTQVVGVILKENFGLRMITAKLSDAIKTFRDDWLVARSTKKQTLEQTSSTFKGRYCAEIATSKASPKLEVHPEHSHIEEQSSIKKGPAAS